jgi:ABC-type nitrate/sulfonate/bicarbonate transport system permease component
MSAKAVLSQYAALPIVILLAWQAASTSGIVNGLLFPPPTDVLSSIATMTASGELLFHARESLWRVLVGLASGALLGAFAGLMTGRVTFLDRALSPALQVMRSFPPVAIIPLVIVWFGIGEAAKIFSIGFAVFFPVWINTHIGASNIPAHYLHAASTLTSSAYKTWYWVILPASLPYIAAGVRTGISVAYIMVFVSELAGSSSGLGYLISVSHLSYRMDDMVAGLFVLGLMGASTDRAFAYATGRMLPWMGKMM